MNRFTAHTVNERECQYLGYGGFLLLIALLFYESVLLQQKTLLCEAIFALKWPGYNEIEKLE
jgi:hypothetical protein